MAVHRSQSYLETAAAAETPPQVIPSKVLGWGRLPLGLLLSLVGIWAGMAPYVGPAFGYSVDGSSSWHWNLAHALLGLAPGAVALVAGLVLAAGSAGVRTRGRSVTAFAALVAAVAGAWLAIGPFAWPALYRRQYFTASATPLAHLANVIGAAVGPALLLAFFGGMGIVAARHAGAVLPVGGAALRRAEPVVPPMRLVVPAAAVTETTVVAEEPVVAPRSARPVVAEGVPPELTARGGQLE